MRPIRERQRVIKAALVALAASAALMAATAPRAAAAPAATFTPTNTCWLDVVNDWLQHNGQIHGLYAIPCYTQAIQHLNLYPDIQQYSNAIDDIQRALLAAIHQERGSGPGGGPSNNGGGGSAGGGGSGGGSTGGGSGGAQSPIGSIFHPSNAQSIPLPLIVLAALAVLLMLAGAGTWFARRVQARRVAPTAPPQPR